MSLGINSGQAAPFSTNSAGPTLRIDRDGVASMLIEVSGSWHLRRGMPTPETIERDLAVGPQPERIVIRAERLGTWDSSLVNFLTGLAQLCRERGIEFVTQSVPPGLARLLELAETVPEKEDARPSADNGGFIHNLGVSLIAALDTTGDFVEFLGRLTIAMGRVATWQARFRSIDLLEQIQGCGANALGIVTLISFLVGVILAFMGAIQLEQFGASIYVADLVAIGMVREMGAMMTGIIMAGRTGAAFAAQLGTMKVTQEIDALTTAGISPLEFLVVPRVIALVLMMPLLTLYADFVGVLGGACVGTSIMNLSFTTYMNQSFHAITGGGLIGGLVKASVYGILIAFAGCYQGFNCENSSSAVGDAATRAVVNSIVLIVVACGIFAVIFHILYI
jgi:phospholipid/cholesterol/gamma-HCH transport system permease protein